MGYEPPTVTHKLILYTDDMLFLLQDPVTSLRSLGSLVSLFGMASGYVNH